MEEPVDFHDWELLQTSDEAENLKPSKDLEAESDDGGAIKSDYFALDSDARYLKRATLGGGASEEEGLADSDNPSWVDPESESRYVDRPNEEMGLTGVGFPLRDFSGFWSDESSDGQRSQIDSQKGELVRAEDSKFGLPFKGIEDGHHSSDGEEANKDASFGGIREIGRGEMDSQKPSEVGSDASAEMGENRMSSEGVSVGGEERMGMVWWKLPLEFIKFCVFRVKPVWSISIAAAILGLVMLGRRLHKMKHKNRSFSLKFSIDKKATHFKIHAARLNEAFSVVRRVPILRASFPAGGVIPWPVVGFQ